MANTPVLKTKPPLAESQQLTCRLRSKEFIGRNGPVPHVAELELENLSGHEIEIEYQMAVLQYLDLIVRDATGKTISDRHYGDRFSPFELPKVLCIPTGQKFRANVNLFATVSQKPVAPGTYNVQAVFEYNDVRAESEPLEVTV